MNRIRLFGENRALDGGGRKCPVRPGDRMGFDCTLSACSRTVRGLFSGSVVRRSREMKKPCLTRNGGRELCRGRLSSIWGYSRGGDHRRVWKFNWAWQKVWDFEIIK